MQEIVELLLSSGISILTVIFFTNVVISNKKNCSSRKFVIYFVTVILYALNSKYSFGTIKTIINYIIHVYFFYSYVKLNFTKSVFTAFIYALILMIIEFIVLFFIIIVLDMPKDYCYEIYAGSLLSNFIICTITIIFSLLLRKKINYIIEAKIESNNNILILSILTLLCIIVLFFNVISDYKNNNSIYSYILLIVIFLVIIANLIKEKIAINDKIQEYNGLLGFMKSYESEIEENKIQNHEIKNQFLTIESMLMDNAPKHKIVDYVKSVINDNKDIDDARYTDLQYLPLNGLKGFICSKLNRAEQENLNVSVIVEKGVEKSIISKLSVNDFKKLGILLGVFFDNAIEASILSNKKCLGLEIYLEKDDVMIIITNTFENDIKSDESNTKRISTKGTGRGHGLQLVNKVVSGSKKFLVQSEIMEKAYIQKIIVKK